MAVLLAPVNVATERAIAEAIVFGAGGVAIERKSTMGVIEEAGGIGKERGKTKGVVTVAVGVFKERLIADSRVVACLVSTHCLKTDGGVVEAGDVIS